MSQPWWSLPAPTLLSELRSTRDGLTEEDAASRLAERGANALDEARARGPVRAFLAQLANPLAWLLLFAVAVSSVAREWTDAAVILGILLLGAVLGFVQERRASRAIEALRRRVAVQCDVLRDGQLRSIDARRVVTGDVVLLSAGSLVPADGRDALRVAAPEFRTAWFVESLLTELFVALVVRTRRPFWRSRPSRLLLVATLGVAAVTFVLPYTFAGAIVGLVPLPLGTLLALAAITVAYVATVEAFKQIFFRFGLGDTHVRTPRRAERAARVRAPRERDRPARRDRGSRAASRAP